jgi:hypothetical protein
LARWISPVSAGVIAGLNLYVYVGINPLKYIGAAIGVVVFVTESMGFVIQL